MIRWSIQEVRRIANRLAQRRFQPAHIIAWSCWQRDHLMRIARLSFLAPDIITAILEGRQPAELHARKLIRMAALPVEWPAQRKMLGFS